MDKTAIELLKENKKALEFLHKAQGYDFNKEFICIRQDGAFTYNAVKRTIEAHIAGGYTACVLMALERKPYYIAHPLYFIRLTGGKFEATRQDFIDYYKHGIDYLTTKSDFEDYRKHYTKHIYIIAQKLENLAEISSEPVFDKFARYEYIPSDYETSTDRNGNTYIWRIRLKSTDNANAMHDYHSVARRPLGFLDYHRPATVSEIIDPSGYLVHEYRKELARKVEAMREDREREKARSLDTSANEKAIRDLIDDKKTRLATLLTNAGTYEEYNAVAESVDRLKWAVYYFDSYLDRRARNQFYTVEELVNRLSYIQKELEAL